MRERLLGIVGVEPDERSSSDDIVFVPQDWARILADRGIEGVPTLAIEVLSPPATTAPRGVPGWRIPLTTRRAAGAPSTRGLSLVSRPKGFSAAKRPVTPHRAACPPRGEGACGQRASGEALRSAPSPRGPASLSA